MATQLDILNKALTLVGAATVTSITDGTPNAIALGNVYNLALQSVLSECKWNFATKRASLVVAPTNSTNYPQFLYSGEAVVYSLPTDGVIRIYAVNPGYASWREESGFIISDTVGLGLQYVWNDTTTADYPSYFFDAFLDKLCADISYVIVNSASGAAEFVKKYETVSLPKAISANSQTGSQQSMRDDYWVRAKYQDGCTGDEPPGATA